MASKFKWACAASVLTLFTLLPWWWAGGLDRVMAADSSGRAKAQALVAAYAKHMGVHDAVHQTLDADNDRSFGDFGFHYFPEQDKLQARVYIVYADDSSVTPQERAISEKVDKALNDPAIGGMYDRGGGYFFTDKQKHIKFLAKDYSLQTITPDNFVKDVDNLSSLGGIWVMSWFGHAALQSYGAEPLPLKQITRQDDPYKRN